MNELKSAETITSEPSSEQERWLLCDHTGVASGIEYGKKGDKVILVKHDETMALCDNGKELFHIRLEKLSEEKVEPEKILSEKPKSETVKKKSRPVKQKKLF